MPWYLGLIALVVIYAAAFKLNGILWPYLRKVYALLAPRR